MRIDEQRIVVADDTSVSATIAHPEDHSPRGTLILAHGAGTDRTDPLLRALQAASAASGFAGVLFNFPYRERGRWPPDRSPVLLATYRAVIDRVQSDPVLGGLPVVIGGRSLGGRMATHVAAAQAVAGVVCLAFPLHLPKRPAIVRAAHFPEVTAPVLIVQGTRDAMAEPTLFAAAIATLRNATVHAIDGADHGFRVPRRTGRDAADITAEIVATVVGWLSARAPTG